MLKNTVYTDTRPAHIIALEDEYSAYMDANYGPRWGFDEQAIADQMTARLQAEYEFHSIDDMDRMF